MKKADHLKILRDLKYNVPDFFLYEGPSYFYEFSERVSIRTELKEQQTLSPKPCPHFPNMSFQQAMKIIKSIREKYHILVQEGINPEDAICSGTCMYSRDPSQHHITIEVAWGPGTVRRVTGGKEVVDSKTYKYISEVPPEFLEIVRCAQELYSMYSMWKDTKIIVEWSKYKMPVGIKKKQLIFWGFNESV